MFRFPFDEEFVVGLVDSVSDQIGGFVGEVSGGSIEGIATYRVDVDDGVMVFKVLGSNTSKCFTWVIVDNPSIVNLVTKRLAREEWIFWLKNIQRFWVGVFLFGILGATQIIVWMWFDTSVSPNKTPWPVDSGFGVISTMFVMLLISITIWTIGLFASVNILPAMPILWSMCVSCLATVVLIVIVGNNYALHHAQEAEEQLLRELENRIGEMCPFVGDWVKYENEHGGSVLDVIKVCLNIK